MRAIPDVVVVGGGVIGLSIARELAARQQSVLVLDRGNSENAASWAAAGMLAPQSEASGPDDFFHLGAASLRLYPEWVAQIEEESGIGPEYRASGLLVLASSQDTLCELKRSVEWQRAAGLAAELVDRGEVRRLEPQLTMELAGAAHLPGESQVTPRLLLQALRASCRYRKVEIRTGQVVGEVLSASGKVQGVRTASEVIPARRVVIATGVGSNDLKGLDPPLRIIPRKGQILSLAAGARFQRMVRWGHAYIVPRPGGELVVGATNEDAGLDRSLTPAGIGRLLAAAQELSSHLGDCAIREMWTGLRPASLMGCLCLENPPSAASSMPRVTIETACCWRRLPRHRWLQC